MDPIHNVPNITLRGLGIPDITVNGTGIPLMKKLKEKEPFVASVFSRNFIKSGEKVKINKSTLGIELEVCYLIKKTFFSSKSKLA